MQMYGNVEGFPLNSALFVLVSYNLMTTVWPPTDVLVGAAGPKSEKSEGLLGGNKTSWGLKVGRIHQRIQVCCHETGFEHGSFPIGLESLRCSDRPIWVRNLSLMSPMSWANQILGKKSCDLVLTHWLFDFFFLYYFMDVIFPSGEQISL